MVVAVVVVVVVVAVIVVIHVADVCADVVWRWRCCSCSVHVLVTGHVQSMACLWLLCMLLLLMVLS